MTSSQRQIIVEALPGEPGYEETEKEGVHEESTA